jgi:hypothetical protein
MAFDYDRDDTHRRLVVTYRGAFVVAEFLEALARIRADEAWSYAVLYDLRAMTGRPTLDDLKQIVDARDTLRRRIGLRRGAIALLVEDMEMYATACAYAALAGSVIPIEVFRSIDEGNLWLARHAVAADEE